MYLTWLPLPEMRFIAAWHAEPDRNLGELVLCIYFVLALVAYGVALWRSRDRERMPPERP